MVKCLPTMQEPWVQSLGGEDLLEKSGQPTPVLLPGKSHGRRSLVGYSCKESDTTEQLHFHFKAGLYRPHLETPNDLEPAHGSRTPDCQALVQAVSWAVLVPLCVLQL